jgi:RNA polymerase sigma-70 factor (ECF subfamily)
MIDTSEDLLAQLKSDSAQAPWERFFRLYWQPVMRYGVKLGLSRTEAEDVLQETMVDLMRILPTFIYDRNKRFRNFVLTIVHRKCLGVFRARKKEARMLAAVRAEHRLDDKLPASEPAAATTREALWDLSVVETLLFEMSRSGEIADQTGRIYQEYVLQNLPVQEVAERYQCSANTIYQIKHRTQRKLQERLRERTQSADDPWAMLV